MRRWWHSSSESGGEIDRNRWQTFDQWPYFQHFRVEEIARGFYDRLENLQGKNRTFYVGGLMNFELVNHIALYSKHLVRKHFPR